MQDIKIVVKKIFWLFGIFFCCCNMQLFAQEGTYVVTDEAPEIPVFNHDNEVIGYFTKTSLRLMVVNILR